MAALPNTLIAGVGKSGTTSLCDDLSRHRDVYLYHSKETNYFSFNYNRGEAWFRSLFSPDGEKIILDGSADYTTRGRTAEIFARIADLLPDARLLFMVRHPIKRIESHYVQELANGRGPLTFEEALEAWKLVEASLYEKTIREIQAFFPAEQIHTIFLEDYVRDKAACLNAVFEFLEIDEDAGCYAPRGAANDRSSKFVDSRWAKPLRNLPGYYRLKGMLSPQLKMAIKQAFSKRVQADVQWSRSSWNMAMAKIVPDSAAFLARHSKPETFWDLGQSWEDRA